VSAKLDHVPLEEVACDFEELHSKLATGELPPLPFWLDIGNSSYRITEENRKALAVGMLLCLDARGFLGK